MFPTATIVFREFLEIALVVGIVMAATRGLSNRLSLLMSGLGLGVMGAVIIAFFTDSIANAIDGMGQEIFNAAIMFVATGFLGWTVIWMKRHGRELAQNLQSVGGDILKGNKSAYVLIGVVALATFREGAEIVLFAYGMSASGAFPVADIVMGGLIGALGGIAVGIALYMGILKAAQRYMFTVTSWLLILLTAGMAAQGANFLIAAGILPELNPQIWDTSTLISGNSLAGQTLGVLIGYTPRPTGMELLFYCAVLSVVGGSYFIMSRRSKCAKPIDSVQSTVA